MVATLKHFKNCQQHSLHSIPPYPVWAPYHAQTVSQCSLNPLPPKLEHYNLAVKVGSASEKKF